MALRLALSASSIRTQNFMPCSTTQPAASPPSVAAPGPRTDCSSPKYIASVSLNVPSGITRKEIHVARCSVGAAVVAVGQVTEVGKDTFWPIVEAAGEKTVVLDMYTQWCGPCKIMAPKFQELSEKYLDVVFLKLDCNQENKPLAKELGIRVVPTFKILKEGKIVKEVTGAKFDDLVAAIDAVRSS
ncbi:thioredoxin F-type, chloroplastic-like isoform X2 [Punica granatum]|uniref:Thioredoxin F-type, chloroplastic-like isoform X2 n=1 Tax=Punica granatum TaxID=22663 RepID=A0A6P8E2C7_PUNGR|nr:thioredoxin F-type, chloroplastic-like isoform X2 [Punica granatum]